MSRDTLEAGYWWSYKEFYRWGSIFQAAGQHQRITDRARHFLYTTGWKKFEPLWDLVIRAQRLANFRRLLEQILSEPKSAAQPAPRTNPDLPAPIPE